MDHTAKPAGPGQVNINKGDEMHQSASGCNQRGFGPYAAGQAISHLAKPEEHMVIHPG